MPTYLEIVVNLPHVSGTFDYHLPPALEGRVGPGHLVVVPFGQREVQGVVRRQLVFPSVPETRAVKELVDPQPVLTENQLRFAEVLAQSTLAPLSVCVSLMVPPGLSQQVDMLYALRDEKLDPGAVPDIPDLSRRILTLLRRRGALRGRQLDRALPGLNWRPAARRLGKRGLLDSQSVLPPPTVRPKTIRTAQLACPPAAAQAQLDSLGRVGSAALARRQEIIRFLIAERGEVDVAWVYAQSGGNAADLRLLEAKGLIRLGETEIWRDPLEGLEFVPSEPPSLVPHQAEAWQAIQAGLAANLAGESVGPYLLHGVTGSGKTEIYLRAVAEVLEQGGQALVLVPEISLTPQTVRRFLARFPGQVGLIHSRLSPGERYDTWRRARAGLLGVVIGPRSALFTPVPDLKLIVVDESHDDSYYQADLPPHYHARQAAIDYARTVGLVCVLGTATPDVTTRFQAAQGKITYLALPARILAHKEAIRLQAKKLGLQSKYRPLVAAAETIPLPQVAVVDMRAELKSGNRSIFSRELQKALGSVLAGGQQAILFLNRRGTATYVFCRDCGTALRCPRCDTSLTLHRSPEGLTCHHCGYRRRMPKTCPHCQSARIRGYGTGTERVEEEIQKLFPRARTLRWDWETTRQKGAHEIILSHFANQRADLLIGTQMLAKGLDLPMVTLVGVVLADVGLHLPDYRAGERTFQVLTQVAGRAGRSPLGGQVILQTFHPEHYVIRAAAGHDYAAFHKQELGYRRRLGYPPFNELVRLEIRQTDRARAEREARAMAARLRAWLAKEDRRETDLIGPAPCFYARLDRQYRWQVILRGPRPQTLLQDKDLGAWRVEVNPPSLL